LLPRHFIPASPTLRPAAFNHEGFIFELKMDSFRALVYVGPNETRLVSRKGNV
jgi:ATP-dependent DNA ligase